MGDTSNIGLVVAMGTCAASSAAAIIAVITFWMKLDERITMADQAATSARQDAAEAKNDHENLREFVVDQVSDVNALIEKRNRENGESIAAIRQHVTDVAMFVRDNFVRQPDFSTAIKRIEDGQLRMEEKLDRVVDKMK